MHRRARGRIAFVTLTLKAHVRGGRLMLDEPVDLPDGTEVELMPVEDADDLDAADRSRLHAAIERSAEEFRQGQTIPAAEVLAALRAGRAG